MAEKETQVLNLKRSHPNESLNRPNGYYKVSIRQDCARLDVRIGPFGRFTLKI
jgi:hypothetical protein